jgi:outer membrane lipoprotein SlyB
MLKRVLRAGAVFVMTVLLLQTTALAEVLEGRVAKVYPSAIDLVVYDPNGRPYPNTLPLKVTSRTRFSGVTSLNKLKANDAVGVTVHQEESRVWTADQVTKFSQVNARPATQNPPPTLRDVLGNPVVKGALTGAATGAIASGVSGGKAGKGALVGAGVGAAAGLLEGLFSQPAQRSSTRDEQY